MIPHKKTIKDESFYLYGYELPTAVARRTLIQVKRHRRIQKEETSSKKTA